MSNILIQNKGELPLWGMRLLGLSNKNADQIGQFGTGLKESIALLARLEQLPVIFSGDLRIDFKVLERDDQQEICFHLSQPRGDWEAWKWHGMGMHPDFGKADWNDAWMIFREIICNALDESGVDDLHHDVTSSTLEGVPGATRVYIPVTPKILEAYTKIHDRLLLLSDVATVRPVYRARILAKKANHPGLQVFHRGVWIQESTVPSLYDYEIGDLKLNESRSADWYDVNSKIARVVSAFGVEEAKVLIARMLIDKDAPSDGDCCLPDEESDRPHFSDRAKCYEEKCLAACSHYTTVSEGEAWREAFSALFGNNAVMCTNDKFYYDRLNDLGRKPVIVEHDGLRSLLKAAGVPFMSQILTEEQQAYEELREPDDGERAVFGQVWDLFSGAGMTQGKAKPGHMMFRQRPGKAEAVFGEYRKGICYINIDYVGSAQERRACIEEIAHHLSGAMDHSKEFQHYLLELADAFMLRKEVV